MELFRDRPGFAADLLEDRLGIPVPAFEQAQVESGELNDIQPTEYRADLVVSLTKADEPVLGVVVEAQLGTDKQKRRSWPAYVATLHARLGCPVVLLVVCADSPTATVPIPFGIPNLVLTPVVVGPRQIPTITDPEIAQQCPELTVLSAMAHSTENTDQKLLFEAFRSALDELDPDHAQRFADVVLSKLQGAARDYLERLMTTSYRYESDFARRYYGEGQAEGKADAVLKFLAARGIDVTAEMRERITQCTAPDQLDTWIVRAATVATADELFI